jgi:hypothetical protein
MGKELTRSGEPVSSKPSEQLLRAVRRHHEADDDPDHKKSNAQCLWRNRISIHGGYPWP